MDRQRISFFPAAGTVATVLVSVFLLQGCRSLILEDRTECPAWITLQAVPPVNAVHWPEMDFRLTGPGFDGMDRTSVRTEVLNEGWQFKWKKGGAFTAVSLTGWDGGIDGKNGLLTVPEGTEIPEAIGGYIDTVLGARLEQVEFPLPVRALYTNVIFDVQGASTEYPFLPVVKCAVDGYILPQLTLHTGSYSCPAAMISYRVRVARIPRQDDAVTKTSYAGGLYADFLFKLDENDTEWTKFHTLPLGPVLTENGYDWTAPFPEDIHVKVDLVDGAVSLITVNVADWEQVVFRDNGKIKI